MSIFLDRSATVRAVGDWLTEARLTLIAKAMVVAFLLSGGATLLLMRDMMLPPERGFGGDFLGVYAAGVLARDGTPEKAYDLAAVAAVQRRVLPQADYVMPWPYPPVFQIVALPLAALPYVWAYVSWAALLLAIYVTTWHRAFGAGSAAFWMAMGSSGVYVNVLHGQNGLLSASLLGVGLLALHSRPWLAGLAIGALCYKPHLGLPIGVLFVMSGQWRAVAGATVAVALLCIASAGILGIDVWRAFLDSGATTRALLEHPGMPLGKLGTAFSFARLLGAAPTPAYAMQGIVAITALLLAIRAWRGPGDATAKAALAVATVPLISPYMFDYDFVILALPIGLLLVDGFRHGWLPWTRPILLLAWLAPGAAPELADATGIQILPFASAALFWIAWRRCALEITPPDGRPRRSGGVPIDANPGAG